MIKRHTFTNVPDNLVFTRGIPNVPLPNTHTLVDNFGLIGLANITTGIAYNITNKEHTKYKNNLGGINFKHFELVLNGSIYKDHQYHYVWQRTNYIKDSAIIVVGEMSASKVTGSNPRCAFYFNLKKLKP